MSEHELIGIRECARRLGVSDTAVRKAIAAGRVAAHDADKDPNNSRPRLRWPQAEIDWKRNSDSTKRTHVGGTGKSPARAKYAAKDAPAALPTRAQVLAGEDGPDSDDDGAEYSAQAQVGGDSLPGRAVQGPSLAQSKAVREAYMARLAKLEYEERVGKLISADEVKARWYKHVTAAKTRIMGIPSACKSRVSDLPLTAMAAIEAVCREALEDLANGRD